MAVANLVDSFYTVHVSKSDSDFKKIGHLQEFGLPNDQKTLDDVTATDDTRQIQAVVGFKENGELEFEYVIEPNDEGQKLIQSAFDDGNELTFQVKFVNLASENRQFKGLVAELSVDNSDTKKKLRKKGKITTTTDISKELS